MKIDNSLQSVSTVSVNDGKRRADITPNPSTKQENSVHLSPNAAKLQSIDSSFASGSIVDTARVQEIKQAISEGNFHINPEVVADRLLETVKELIQSKKGAA
ncbi:flagellar biosynthesis anti-sigma factor FlgM [Nitrosomonas supralitoralis]|uniref:Negative regulator of flagellin synthesis n=1 Tax=Nitrosomonas supralitoralis TaxID=2116706 RepID=A0A2P7NV51_9PROT|nr:flagellar biosynthesis anti-sigma factor FlgM [Nitrosomonas supralitoralis]PSJ17346.1 flagellar biosynthesis anti-sigma factor FlgM [Nitrosomonas supralitoralis]